MLKPLEIFIPGRPSGKGRPRFGKGVAYTPERTRQKEREIAQLAKISMMGQAPFTGAVKVTVKAWMKGQRTARPDADNIGKLALDALNGIVFTDDRQVVELIVQKISGLDPQTMVRVEEA
jgi:Holliday junction resolvase RusA-like endonuclease